jgi:hypothetical protein
MRELKVCFKMIPDAADLLLEDIGFARYEKIEQIREAETFLVVEGSSAKLAAATGLEALYRNHGQYPVSEQALMFLRRLVVEGPGTRVRVMALMALQAARDHDTATLRSASINEDAQVRRLVAGSLDLSNPEQARLGENLQNDDAFQVRYDLLAATYRVVRQTHLCAPLVARFKDLSPACRHARNGSALVGVYRSR